MSGKKRDADRSRGDKPAPESDAESVEGPFEEVQCDNYVCQEAKEGFKVLLGYKAAILVCRKCGVQYDLVPEMGGSTHD